MKGKQTLLLLTFSTLAFIDPLYAQQSFAADHCLRINDELFIDVEGSPDTDIMRMYEWQLSRLHRLSKIATKTIQSLLQKRVWETDTSAVLYRNKKALTPCNA